MQKLMLALSLLFASSFTEAQGKTSQDSTKVEHHHSMLAGIGYSKHFLVDLGVASYHTTVVGPHPLTSAYSVSSEIYMDKHGLIAPKISTWVAGGAGAVAFGLNVLYYTDFSQSALVLRPEIGFGSPLVKLAYGYNARLSHKPFDNIGKNVLSMIVYFDVKPVRKSFRLRHL